MPRHIVPTCRPAREKVTSLPPRRGAAPADHFSARIEPKPVFFDIKSTARAGFDKKVEIFREQNRVVAAPSQFETSLAQAFAARQPN
jgi:hypothetical protein